MNEKSDEFSLPGDSPIIIALMNCNDVDSFFERAVAEIEKGEDIDAPDARGNTALLWACNDGSFPIARFLVERGADVNATNSEGYTPLGRVPGQATELMAYLRNHGARV